LAHRPTHATLGRLDTPVGITGSEIRGHKLTSRFLTAICLAAATLLAPVASAQLTKEARATLAFGDELDQAAKAPDFVGLAVAVVRDGRVVLTRTYGVREAGGTEPVTPDTVFRLASVSKGFAAALAAMEVKEGKFGWEDPIVKSVPQFKLRTPKDTAAVTVEDVLSHRTGLPPFAYDNLLEAGTKPLEILNKYGGLKLSCTPGSCYGYQNTSFNMIATVIEQATGEPYTAALRERILDPLGMKTASFGLNGLSSTGNWARPHVRRNNAWQPTPVKQPYYDVPAAGGMNASITDLSQWLAAQMGARPDVLPPDIVAELRKPRISTPSETNRQRILKTPVKSTNYGLGWRVFDYAGHKLVNHSGGVEGYFAMIAWLPDRNAGIVILSNTRGARAGKILPTWLDYELGLPKQDWFKLGDLAEASAAAGSGD
jgi:beta-lactamase class C